MFDQGQRNVNRTEKSLFIIILAFISLLNWQEVSATGGAFDLTKHGGGTTDGDTPYDAGNGPGVDRTINSDYTDGTQYDESNIEAGKYRAGDCNQCHEPHASFGGSEPAPNTGGDEGPDAYLALKDYGSTANYSNLCWYCHQYFSNINGSGSPVSMGKFRFYQGQTVYQESSHYIDVGNNMYWPGDGSGSPIWPRKSRQLLASGNRGSCVNCHTPHGVMAAGSGSAYDISAVPAIQQTTARNLSVSQDYLIPRQLIAWEEALCEGCHSSSGPAIDIESEINKRHFSGSGHPIDDTSLAGRHIAGENTLVTTSKHVECYDCHNPHAVKIPSGVRGDGNAGRVEGMKYIEINKTERDPTVGAVRQPFIHEVCLKCHGDSFDCVMPYVAHGAETIQPTCVDGSRRHRGNEKAGVGYNFQLGASNKRKEFDSTTVITMAHGADNESRTNGSWHPVGEPGLNRSIQLCNQLATAFNLICTDIDNNGIADGDPLGTLTINCTDCHNNNATDSTIGPVTESSLRTDDEQSKYLGIEPLGPHGSVNKRILRANYDTKIGTSEPSSSLTQGGPIVESNYSLCFLCHDSTPFTTKLMTGAQAGTTGLCDPETGGISNCRWTNFYTRGETTHSYSWSASLHYYHLSTIMADGIRMKCHECHNNMHSNVEANNTQFYGDTANINHMYPPDGNTHLINFGPQAMPGSYIKPAFFWDNTDGVKMFTCNMKCHGITMTSCKYRGQADHIGGGDPEPIGEGHCL